MPRPESWPRITSTPSQAKVRKTALGAQNSVPWSYHRNALDAVQELGQLGYRIWSLENRGLSRSVFDLTQDMMAEPLILVVGNELSGIDPDILKLSDQVISVPMVGLKASLNVVVAFGVAAYRLQFGLRSSREKS